MVLKDIHVIGIVENQLIEQRRRNLQPHYLTFIQKIPLSS